MVLVDTSVWIRFLSGTHRFDDHLSGLLERDEVMGHSLIYGELLIGNRGGRQKFLHNYARIVQASSVSHFEVVEFVVSRHLNGLGIGWIDASLLASVALDRTKIWTVDESFRKVARDEGLAYEPPLE